MQRTARQVGPVATPTVGWAILARFSAFPHDLRTVLVPEPVRVLPKDTGGESELRGLSSERRLLERVQAGSRSAVDALFERYGSWLRRWARGRLPVWVRGAIDTNDVIQDTLQHTFAQLGGIKPMRDGGRRAAGVRLRVDVYGGGCPDTSGGQVSIGPASGPRGDGGGLPGARSAARARRGRQDPDGYVACASDGPEAGSLGHGDGVPPGGVAQVYGIESWRGRPFLIVELLAGGTLADRLRRGPVPPAQPVAVTTTLAGALATLHEAGYLHGDVKPSNVGLTSNGSPKLLDFGLARAANDADTRGGTLRYLSPEVLSGRPPKPTTSGRCACCSMKWWPVSTRLRAAASQR